jgi:hypothetical protein
MSDKFPGWRYGPNGQSAIFESEKDIPAGWVDHPSLVKGAAKADKPKTDKPSKAAKPPKAPKSAKKGKKGKKAGAPPAPAPTPLDL